MSVGLVFASTGGPKIARAIRSLRVAEPDVPIYVVLDVSSKTYEGTKDNPSISWLESLRRVTVRPVQNKAYINGCLNEAMRWMRGLGYDYACLFHDDVIFSPLSQGHVTEWFTRLETEPELQEPSALTLSLMQAFVPKVWRRPPAEWDVMDLESISFWEKLLPNGKPAGFLEQQPDNSAAFEVQFPDFYVQYHVARSLQSTTRLGPTGQIVSIDRWAKVGGFDETLGIFYDMQYPAECAARGWPPVKMVPNIPHLHLHNQSIGYEDLAFAHWTDCLGAFETKFGDYETFWNSKEGWR
jgi:hypothetical protein